MVRLNEMNKATGAFLAKLPCPVFDSTPWVDTPPLNELRVAIVSTAGLHHRDDKPFSFDTTDMYRVIPTDISSNDLIMSHVSTNFDRTGFAQDWNVVFPLDRLKELSEEGAIGSVADFHYSFMGAMEPEKMEASARSIAVTLKKDKVNAVFLVPV
jgi:D-proline reductase (dithiol) PrdB